MKEKYITEQFPHWFNHGGTIIASNTKHETWLDTELPKEALEEHNKTVDKLVGCVMFMFDKFPEEAEKFWYKDFPSTP